VQPFSPTAPEAGKAPFGGSRKGVVAMIGHRVNHLWTMHREPGRGASIFSTESAYEPYNRPFDAFTKGHVR